MGVLQTLSTSPDGGESVLRYIGLVNLVLVSLAGLPLAWVLIDYLRVLKLRQRLPPGPFPLPLVGNYYQIPKVKPWIAFEAWAQHYNDPMITIWQGHKPTIMCNDAWSISEMLDKRANLYSSRPRMIAMGDMVHATDTNQVCLVYGDKWRQHRRLMVREDRTDHNPPVDGCLFRF